MLEGQKQFPAAMSDVASFLERRALCAVMMLRCRPKVNHGKTMSMFECGSFHHALWSEDIALSQINFTNKYEC